jgi:hypothetical protein
MTTNNVLDTATTPVPNNSGGTGKASFTAYCLLTTGTTTGGAFQNCAIGTAGQYLQNRGASTLPTFTTMTNRLLGFQYLTATTSSTYTPTSVAVNNILVECLGGGGGGGGVAHTAAGVSGGGGGASGTYVRKWIASIGPTYTATYQVGAFGAGGTAGANNGTAGSASTWSDGTVSLSAGGGLGGSGFTSNAVSNVALGGLLGAASGGDINCTGTQGNIGIGNGTTALGGAGGAGIYGGSGNPVFVTSGTSNGTTANAYGSGGSGGAISVGGSDVSGGNGSNGTIIVWEYN